MGRISKGPNNYHAAVFGSVTDINVWNKTFTSSDVDNFVTCEDDNLLEYKVMDWKKVDFEVIKGYQVVEASEDSICNTDVGSTIVGNSREQRIFDDCKIFCEDVFDGSMAVAYDEAARVKMTEEAKMMTSGEASFFNGYIRNGSEFVSVYNSSDLISEDLTPWSWQQGQPNNYGGNQDCVAVDNNQLNDYDCATKYNALCQVNFFTIFQFEGFCDGGMADYTFVMAEVSGGVSLKVRALICQEKTFFGYGYTKLYLNNSKEPSSWILVDSRTNDVILSLETYSKEVPIGRNQWKIENGRCRDKNKTELSLNFHKQVDQPGLFCCDDGTCIPSEHVCDSVDSCPGNNNRS